MDGLPGGAWARRDRLDFPPDRASDGDTGLEHATGKSRMQVIFPDLVEELPAADPEPFGGLGPVALAGDQGALDRATLDVGEEGAERDRFR